MPLRPARFTCRSVRAPSNAYARDSRSHRSRGALRAVLCAREWQLRSASPSELEARLADGLGKPQPDTQLAIHPWRPPGAPSWRHAVFAASSASAFVWLLTTRIGCAALTLAQA